MIATITPAGCGGRHRHILALGLFGAGALAASAALGAAAGALGLLVPAPWLVVAAVLAMAAALRDGAARWIPVPQRRAQVPERWRRELPRWLWPPLYGAGLGAGVLTHVPLAAFWAALGAAAATRDPLLGAACLMAFGAGRALMVAGPTLAGADADHLLGASRGVRRAAVAVTAGCAATLALAATGEARPLPLGGGSQFSPSVSGPVFAYAERSPDGNHVVVTGPQGAHRLFHGSAPSVDGALLAMQTPIGITIIRWPDGTRIGRVPGRVSQPALDQPYLVFVQRAGAGSRLVVVDLRDGSYHVLTAPRRGVRISHPAVHHGRVAWAEISASGSRIMLSGAGGGPVRQVVSSHILLLDNPSLSLRSIAWTEAGPGPHAVVRVASLRGDGPGREVLSLDRGPAAFGATALQGTALYVTRYVPGGRSRILLVPA
jgi:hypothetical protein